MDFYRLWQIINESKGIKNEWDPNEPDEGPEDHAQFADALGVKDMEVQLTFRNGVFHDVGGGRTIPPIPHPQIHTIIENPDDTYTMHFRIIVSGDYIPGYDAGGGDSEDDKFHGEPNMEVESAYIENNRTKKGVEIPSTLVHGNVVGLIGSKAAYQVDYDLGGRGKINIAVK